MAVTTEQIIEAIGLEIPQDATPEVVKDLFSKSYVSSSVHEQELGKWKSEAEKAKAEIDSALGKVKGSTETVLKRILGDAAKDAKDYNELLKITESTMSEKLAEMERLRKLAEGKSGDVVKEIEAKYQKQLSEYQSMNEQLGSERETLLQQIEAAKKDADNRVQSYLTEQKIKGLYNGANWSETANDYTKKGLWADKIEGKYQFKIEGEKVLVYDAEGNIVKDGANHLTAEKLFTKLLEEEKLLKKNGATSGTGSLKREGQEPANPKLAAHIQAMREKAERDRQTIAGRK